MKRIILAAFIFLKGLNAFSQNIPFTSTELYPEGITYNGKEDVFYVSSLHYGKIGKVNRKGEYSEFISDTDLISSIGIHINTNNSLLYACVSDPGVSVSTGTNTRMKLAKVIAYDLETGKRKFIADLGSLNKTAANFANDLDFDKKGNAYVTNSASPIIYKITPTGNVTIFAVSDSWKKEGFSLNGIVCHPSGYLLTIQSNTGDLYKVSLTNPKEITKVKSDLFLGGDGLILNGKNELVVICNGGEIYKVKSNDNFATASVESKVTSEINFPTTGVFANGKYYVLDAKLNEIFTPGATKTSSFLIQEIKF